VTSLLDFEWDMKFYFLHIKSDKVGTTFKHPETINGNVKNLRIKRKDKGNVNFYCKNLLFNITINCQHFLLNPFKKINLACWWGLVPTRPSQALLLLQQRQTQMKKKTSKKLLYPHDFH
jgi:hypothetical protein